jgi:hypothetical protein
LPGNPVRRKRLWQLIPTCAEMLTEDMMDDLIIEEDC